MSLLLHRFRAETKQFSLCVRQCIDVCSWSAVDVDQVESQTVSFHTVTKPLSSVHLPLLRLNDMQNRT